MTQTEKYFIEHSDPVDSFHVLSEGFFDFDHDKVKKPGSHFIQVIGHPWSVALFEVDEHCVAEMWCADQLVRRTKGSDYQVALKEIVRNPIQLYGQPNIDSANLVYGAALDFARLRFALLLQSPDFPGSASPLDSAQVESEIAPIETKLLGRGISPESEREPISLPSPRPDFDAFRKSFRGKVKVYDYPQKAEVPVPGLPSVKALLLCVSFLGLISILLGNRGAKNAR